MNWLDKGAPYLAVIHAAEDTYAIPTNLLARVAYQECSWRYAVISGAVTSPVGAVGMMQLMPQYFPGAGVSWETDVHTAGQYLANLYQRFHDWQLAVAAYNDGPGNVDAYLKHERVLPQETEDYVAQVFADVPVNGAILNA